MKATKWELHRREFLRGLGAGVALLPLLTETQARANTAAGGRLLVMVKGNGVRAETFWPTFPNQRPSDGALTNASFPHATAPLAPYKDRLMFLDGLTLRNWLKAEGNPTGDDGDAHHAWGSLLTGELPSDVRTTDGGCGGNSGGCRMQAGSASLDCFVGQELRKKDTSLLFDSVHVSLNVDDLPFARRVSGYNCPSWFRRDQPNPPEPDAKTLFARLFGGARMPMGGGTSPETARAKDKVRLLDFVGKDLERFTKRLGSEDRMKAEAHLDSVKRRQDELNRILTSPALACTPGAAPTADYITKREEHVPALSKLMADMIIDAFKCGVTRSACYSLFDSNTYHTYFTWMKNVNANFGGVKVSEFGDSHFHAITHAQGGEPVMTMYRDANRWFMEQYAYVLKRLTDEKEGLGNMLDNTLVLWADGLSDGGRHLITRLPWILAGNVNKRFRTGRHVKLPDNTATNGLFFSIADALGVAPAAGHFGNAKFGNEAHKLLIA